MDVEIFMGAVMVFSFVIIGFLLWKQNQGSEDNQEMREMLDTFHRDREDRYREQESLRNELRENSKSLREEFHRVNRTVDTKLSESSKQLNERLDKSSSVIGHLQKELGKMGEIGSKIESLDKVLRAPKGRGNMGEESLEEILKNVLPASLWERQYSLGTGMVVDCIIRTSNGLIPIDAKFPLPAFEAIVESETDEQREVAQKQFLSDMKKHINDVSKYIRPESETLDFAILFLPNENIYYEAAVRSRDIYEHAREKKILLTGPNTIVHVLQVILHAYRSQEFAKEAQRALAELTAVKSQAERLDEGLGVLAKHLGNANTKMLDVQSENQKLQNQIDKVSQLEGKDNFEQDKLL